MRGKSTVILILTLLLLGVGATFYLIMQFFEDNPTQPHPTNYLTGIIIDIKGNGSILVVSDLSVEEAKQLTSDDVIATGKEAAWFSINMDQRNQLTLYDNVKVGYESLNESYPAQGSAKTLEILNAK